MIFSQPNYALIIGTHYPTKHKSMSEIENSKFATNFEICLILTDSYS